MVNSIKLEKEALQQKLISQIKTFFQTERDETLGEFAHGKVLKFIVEKCAPTFYNQGVQDAYNYLNELLPDLLEIQK